MRLDVSKLKTKGQEESFSLTEKWDSINYKGDILKFIEPISFNGVARNVGESIEIKGVVKSNILTQCYRCLEDTKLELELEYLEEFTKKDISDDNTHYYSDDTIELNETVLATIILNLPMKFLCKDDCKGLCPVCGTNLNIQECNCIDDNVDPRLSILKTLLEKYKSE